MFKKVTTAAFLMTIQPLEITFAAEPAIPQDHVVKQSLTSDICAELVSLNREIFKLAEDNNIHTTNLQQYVNNFNTIQQTRNSYQAMQQVLQADIENLTGLQAWVKKLDKLEVNDSNKEFLDTFEKGIVKRNKKKSNKNNKKDIKFDHIPYTLSYLEYDQLLLTSIVNKYFYSFYCDNSPTFNKNSVSEQNLSEHIEMANSYQKAILKDLETLSKMEKSNRTYTRSVKSILKTNLKYFAENNTRMQTILQSK